jgi:hypothetical protein
MSNARNKPSHPGLVVLRHTGPGCWELVGEVTRPKGLTARAAQTAAVMEASKGKAQAEEIYAAVLLSERRLALDWAPY